MADKRNDGQERKNFVIKTLIIILLILMAFLSTVLYVYAYPKTEVVLWGAFEGRAGDVIKLDELYLKKYSKMSVKPS